MIRWFSRTLYTHFFHVRVVLCQFFDTVNGNIKNRKKLQLIQTIWDAKALLTVLDFPLETTCSCKQDTKERYWGQQFWQMERHISVVWSLWTTFKAGPEYSGRTKPKWSVPTPFDEPTEISGILGWMESALSLVPKRTSDISLYIEPLFSGHLY